MSISGLARKFGVSRVHVRKILREAVGAGYLERIDGDDSKIVVLAPLRVAIETFFANAFLLMRDCAQGAFDEVEAMRTTNGPAIDAARRFASRK